MSDNGKKIVFFGTPEFAVASLDALVAGGFDVAAVVTATDKPAGRGHKLLPSAVKQYALEHGIEVLQPDRLRDEAFIDQLRRIDADLFVVIAFRMLPEVVWGMPRLGTFNLHGSLLPAYRGAAPINWAVINGEKSTGVTTFFLSHEIDTGDIIDFRRIEIGEDENVGSVHDRLMAVGAELTVATAKAIFDGTVISTPQDEIVALKGIVPSPAPKIFRETCRIDWNKPSREIHNFIRGLSPYPAAVAAMNVDNVPCDVKILEARPEMSEHNLQPGKVVQSVESGKAILKVATSDGFIDILRLQIPGKRPVTPVDLRNGHVAVTQIS